MKNYQATKTKSLDYVLVRAIQKSVDKKLLKIVQDKSIKYRVRKEAFDQMVFLDQDATGQLWVKYFKFFKKMKFKLIRTCLNHNMACDKWIDEYDSRAFLRFLWCVCVIRPAEIEHLKDSWSIYQHLWGNFMSMNRDFIKEFLTESKHEEQIYGYQSSDEENTGVTNLDKKVAKSGYSVLDNMMIDEDKKLFWDCWKLTENRMSDVQIKIAQGLKNGETPANIRKVVGLSPKGFKEEVESIKRTFSVVISSLSRGRGDQKSYRDLVNIWS